MIRRTVKSMLRRCGFELRRYRLSTSESARMAAMLASHRVDVVFDVGANVGQFVLHLREIGYRGRVISFEPLSVAHEVLSRTAGGDASWTVAPRAAIGYTDGEAEINIAGNSESSSVLPMLESHRRSAPESVYTGIERVPLRRLDTLASGYLEPSSRAFLKIDTQGYEHQVLEGAAAVLPRVVGVQLEMSLTPLYEGGRLMPEMVKALEHLGFELWGLNPAFVDPTSGRVLQVDGTFFRSRNDA